MENHKMKAWIIDDDETTREIIRKTLEEDGYGIKEFDSAEGVVEALDEDAPDVICLDVKMPGQRGTELCRDIRAVSNVPIIFLSSASDPVDKIIGLEVGADDYLPKPFDPRELSARIRAVQRRRLATNQAINQTARVTTTPNSEAAITIGILTIDSVGFRTIINDTELQLTRIEFEILRTLMSEPERVFSREALMDSAYDGVRVSKKTIDSHVHRVRANFLKFGIDPIRTVRGFGYSIDHAALKA